MLRLRGFLVALLVVAASATASTTSASGAAKPKPPKLTGLRCVPVTAPACKPVAKVSVGDLVLLRGQRLAKGQKVTFAWSKGSKAGKTTKQKGLSGYVVKVPRGTPNGTIKVTVKDRRGRRSNALKLKVVAKAIAPVPATPTTPALPAPSPNLGAVAQGINPVPTPFTGAGMWVVNLTDAEGGVPASLINRAQQSRISTIFLKSADGTSSQGSQFSADLVTTMHQAGIRLCAWQYVYGTNPAAEAAVALQAYAAGADCFVIDAEKEYAGRYAAARTYLAALRAGTGADYPIGFTSYAIPEAQPTLPFSVFLGPGGAQVNMPQIYWGEANEPVASLSFTSAARSRVYGRPLVPLGQTYGGTTTDDIQAFRSAWRYYGAPDVSWFRWGGPTITPPEVWAALATPTPMLDPPADPSWRLFQQGDSGDGVCGSSSSWRATTRAS